MEGLSFGTLNAVDVACLIALLPVLWLTVLVSYDLARSYERKSLRRA